MRLDLPALTRRLNLLHVIRVLAGAATVTVALALPDRFTVAPSSVVAAVGLVPATTLAAEVARRHGLLTTDVALRVVLVTDAGLFAVSAAWSGEASSPVVPAALIQLVAVTILLSWRTGLEAAVLDGVAFTLTHAGLVIGVIPGAGEPVGTSSLVTVLLTFGACATLTAICSSYDRRALRQSRQHFQALSELALALELATDADGVISVLATHLGRHLGFRRVAVLIPTGDATAAVTWSSGRLTHADLHGALLDDPLVRPALQEHQPVLRRVMGAMRSGSLVAEALPDATQVAVIAMRTTGDELGGVMAIGESGARPVGRSTAEVLHQAAAHGASALRNCQLLAELERQAARDPLTGLANRRCLDDNLERALSRSRRDGSPLSLVVLDIDHFKAVNDQHGHQVGDQVLRTVALILATGVRDVDLPARFGGEEFVLLLPGTSLSDAAETAERLCRDVASLSSPLPVTISAGVASFPHQGRSGAELLALADAALYEAKRGGRDRVVIARPATRAVQPRRTA